MHPLVHIRASFLTIPEVASTYYSADEKMDNHNRYRQDDLNIEGSFEVKECLFRLNYTIFWMNVVDYYFFYKLGRGSRFTMNPSMFFTELANQLCYNKFDEEGLLHDSQSFHTRITITHNETDSYDRTLETIPVLVEAAESRRSRLGVANRAKKQKRCRICKKKTKWVCSVCKSKIQEQPFFCQTIGQVHCFAKNINM